MSLISFNLCLHHHLFYFNFIVNLVILFLTLIINSIYEYLEGEEFWKSPSQNLIFNSYGFDVLHTDRPNFITNNDNNDNNNNNNNNKKNQNKNKNNKNNSLAFWFFIFKFAIVFVLFLYFRDECQPMHINNLFLY